MRKELAAQALVLSVSRIVNQGLQILSPVILVRLLTVTQFGQYREFLLYVTLLAPVCGLAINSSLIYFVPRDTRRTWSFVQLSVVLVACSTALVLAGLAVGNLLSGWRLVPRYFWELLLYLALLTNIDFWESLWLAQGRTSAVFAYTSGRLIVRLLVIIVAAAISHEVGVILLSLIVMEALRVAISVLAWRRLARGQLAPLPAREWREQLQWALPVAVGTVIVTVNDQVGGVFIVRILGAAALAQYAIGGYAQLVISAVRNSVSDVLLPAMAGERQVEQVIAMWKDATVVFTLLLLPCIALMIRFADPLITFAFSPSYHSAVPVFQAYALTLVFACFDFPVFLRAINRTRVFIVVGIVTMVVNLGTLVFMTTWFGLVGAVASLLLTRLIAFLWYYRLMVQFVGCAPRELVRWADAGKITLATMLATLVVLPSFWTARPGILGAALGSCCFLACYVLAVHYFHIPEAHLVLTAIRNKAGRLLK
jgi:O-antigen/teichoic acid export membrane protein